MIQFIINLISNNQETNQIINRFQVPGNNFQKPFTTIILICELCIWIWETAIIRHGHNDTANF